MFTVGLEVESVGSDDAVGKLLEKRRMSGERARVETVSGLAKDAL